MPCALWEELPGSNVGVRLSQILHSRKSQSQPQLARFYSFISLIFQLAELAKVYKRLADQRLLASSYKVA